MNEQELANHDKETTKHINEVRTNIHTFIGELSDRARLHDQSKFQEPERSIYAAALPKLAHTEYGSPAYEELMRESKVAIDHHWSKNRHHPEYWAKGLDDMDLIDIMEMLADWAAATKRNKNGNVHKSIQINTPRFNISPQLAQIMTNTVNRYF